VSIVQGTADIVTILKNAGALWYDDKGGAHLDIAKALGAAIAAGLVPIFCVGETLTENQAKRTAEVVSRQVREGLKGLPREAAAKVVVAYEPVWAIGTGLASTGPNANAVVKGVIRSGLEELFGSPTAQSMRVLYGGSVTAANAGEFFSQPEIDGALVGGASLKKDEFIKITQAAVKP
jgi:triosephosphate isomerase